EEAKQAIDVANAALPAWRALTGKERAVKLRKWFDLMMLNQDDLGKIMTLEQGKPLAEAKGEIAYAASFIEWFGEEAKRVYGDTIPGHMQDKRLMVLKQPVGVTAAITPWNFPAAMITRKAGAALAAGCTMVIKPAAETPYSAFALADLAERAGIPAGVLNIITGDAVEIGAQLTSNPIVRKLSFTGSTDAAVKKVDEHLSDAVSKGASILVGGATHALGGTFYQPTVVTGVDKSMIIAKEETFGPLAPLFKFDDIDDVIAQANDTEFGLAAYFYARDISRVWAVAEALEYGMVGVNTGLISTEVAPFGGMKSSGLGREGSNVGIEEYLESKYVCMSI
ncbi:UNVERIFIED_CONTAM: hypothetical protein GTU68_015477, partial [Idotea baltica]|nr:hypothetical protein [Idotea baltica]